MSSMTQEHLDNIAWLEQERRRIKNEEIEIARRSTELSIQRCQTELGITDPTIASTIASEVLRAEEAERLQVAAVRLYSREIQRLVSTGGQPLPGVHVIDGAKRINDVRRELTRAQVELDSGRQERRYRLCRYINQCRVEFTRIQGRDCGFTLRHEIASECTRRPVYDGVGHIVAFGARYLKVGGADDYLTVHNPAYPRVAIVRNIAPNFRNIKVKGYTIAIRALKNAHGYAYAFMMGDRQEFPFGRAELGLLREDPVAKKQPVIARIRDFAVDAGHGRGYALAVQGHGDEGPFHGIASYNRIWEISPNEFFDTKHLSDEKCRMADFNFQLIYGKLPMETEIEVGTLLIEHARYYFGARLFRTECSPLNVRYIETMQALGLERFHTVEPASFNPALAAATWKFDLWSWKAAEEDLKRQGQWFVDKDTMQEDPEAERRPIHEDPEEPLPSLAIVQAVPTVHEDPAAFEAIRQPTHSVQSHSGPVPWPQTSDSIEWSSGSYTGTSGTTDTGTSSGLGYSESDQTHSTSSTFQSQSPTASSSESSASITREASRTFIAADEQLTDSPVYSESRVWQGSIAIEVLRKEEDSRAMPPPELPKRLSISSQQTSSSESSATASSEPDVTNVSMGVDSLPCTPSDAKGSRSASSFPLGEPGPSAQTELPATISYNEDGRVSAQWPISDSCPACALWSDPGLWLHETVPSTEEVLQASVTYDRKGKRPASLTWDAQPKRRSPLRQTLTPEETIGNIIPPSADSVDHRGMSQPLHAPPNDASPKTARPSWPDPNQQFCSRNSAAIQSSHEEYTHFSPRPGQSESNSTSSQPSIAWQQQNHSPAPSPARGHDHLRQQHRTHASQTESFTQIEPASNYILRQPGLGIGYHNMAVYNYVEFVQERPGEQQRQPSRVQSTLPAQKISRDDQQSTVGDRQVNGGKSVNLLNVEKPAKSKQISTPMTWILERRQESNTTRLQVQDERKEQNTSPVSKPSQAPRATAAQSSTILDTLLSNIALVPGPDVTSTSDAASASNAPSTVHLMNDSQLLLARNVHESSTISRERLAQHTAYLTVTPHQAAIQEVTPRQVAHYNTTIAELTSPQSVFPSESNSEKRSKQRPWQL